MLRIVDYAKRSGIEWYEVLRNVVSNEAPSPVVIPTQGEIAEDQPFGREEWSILYQ